MKKKQYNLKRTKTIKMGLDSPGVIMITIIVIMMLIVIIIHIVSSVVVFAVILKTKIHLLLT